MPTARIRQKRAPNRKKEKYNFSSRRVGIAFMLLNTLVWGAAMPISKIAVEATDSFLFLLYRFGFAGLISLPLFFLLWKQTKPTAKNLGEIAGIELLGNGIALALLYEGLKLTSSLEASLLTMTTPIFITLGGILVLGEKEERSEWLGLLLALSGTVLLAFEPLLSGRTNGQLFTSLEGNLLILGSNVLAALYYLLAKRRYNTYPKLFVTGLSFWVGSITFLLISWFFLGSVGNVVGRIQLDLSTSTVLLPSLYMAIFGSIIGLTSYMKGQSHMEASEASLFTYLQPVITIPLAYFLHQESTTPTMLFALLVIGIGVILAELPRYK